MSNNHDTPLASGASADEEENNDEEDSSAEDQDEDNNEEGEEVAPSGGLGRGKGLGKRPIIHVEAADEVEQEDDDDTQDRGAGLSDGMLNAGLDSSPSKKRRFSNLSVLRDGSDDENEANPSAIYPRKKMARRLSNTLGNGLLAYELASQDTPVFDQEDVVIDSDDDDYNDVENVSDSDGDDKKIEKLEKKAIVADPKLYKRRESASSTSTIGPSFEEMWAMDDPIWGTVPGPNDIDLNFLELVEQQANLAANFQQSNEPRQASESSARRVRFNDEVRMNQLSEVSSESSSSTESDASPFPDIFNNVKTMRRELYGPEVGETDAADLSGSDWDFEDGMQYTEYHTLEVVSDSDGGSSSGYESDIGDTTDEEPVPLKTVVPPRTVLHRRSLSVDSDRSATVEPFPRNTRASTKANRQKDKQKASSPRQQKKTPQQVKTQNGLPSLGVWNVDHTKALAVINVTGNISIFPPTIPQKGDFFHPGNRSRATTANNSPRIPARAYTEDDSDLSEPSSSNFRQPTDVMLSGLSGSSAVYGDMVKGQAIGPPEAFYPFVEEGGVYPEIVDEDDDDDEAELKFEDFFDMGDDDDDEDVEQGNFTDAGNETDGFFSATETLLRMPSMMSPSSQATPDRHQGNLLAHFERGIVTSFRNNQDLCRDMAQLPHDPILRQNLQKPVRKGRSAQAPITPLRKRKGSGAAMGMHSSPLMHKAGSVGVRR